RGRLASHQKNSAFGEGDVNLLLGVFIWIEQGGDSRGRRSASPAQAGGGLRHDPLERRQGFDHRLVLGVRLTARGAELRVDRAEKRNKIGNPRKLLDERPKILERFLEADEVFF